MGRIFLSGSAAGWDLCHEEKALFYKWKTEFNADISWKWIFIIRNLLKMMMIVYWFDYLILLDRIILIELWRIGKNIYLDTYNKMRGLLQCNKESFYMLWHYNYTFENIGTLSH